jgi:hypothetical protein
VANLLLDIIRSLAAGALSDTVKEEVVPEAKRMYDEYTREPQRAQTEGARMIDGYPSMSSGLPAETAPYRPNASFKAEPVAPETLQEMLRMGAAAKQNIAGQAYEPVPADGMSAEEEARFAERLNATPSQPIDYTDMDQRLEGQFRQNELDRTIAAENRGNVLDFVRQAGEGMGTAETSPYTPSGDSSAMFKPLSQRVQEKAVEIKSTTPEIQSDTQVTAAASQDVAKELEAEISEKERLGMNADSEKSMLSQLMDGAMSFFGDRNTWMALGAAANELRFKPSDAYRKAMFEEADTQRMAAAAPTLFKDNPQLMNAVKSGALTIKEAMTLLYKNPTKISQMLELMKTPEGLAQLKQLSEIGALGGTTVNMPSTTVGLDESLRQELIKDQAASFKTLTDQGLAAMSTMTEMEDLALVMQMVPTGPAQGRFLEVFPEADTNAAVAMSLIKRIAPTLRVAGSGSTSDIEYAGMLGSLGSFRNDPEANAMIFAAMRNKQQIMIEQAKLVESFRNQEIDGKELSKKLFSLKAKSIFDTPEAKRKILGASGAGDAMANARGVNKDVPKGSSVGTVLRKPDGTMAVKVKEGADNDQSTWEVRAAQGAK